VINLPLRIEDSINIVNGYVQGPMMCTVINTPKDYFSHSFPKPTTSYSLLLNIIHG